MTRRALCFLLSASATLGCAQSKTYTPEVTPVGVELRNLQTNRVLVEVNDLRSEKNSGDPIKAIVREQIQAALGKTDTVQTNAKYRLLVDIVEHRSYFTMGNWNANTRFRARLVAPNGATLGPWEASGSGHRSNMFGYHTAKTVAQDSYNAAISDLLSALNAVVLPH